MKIYLSILLSLFLVLFFSAEVLSIDKSQLTEAQQEQLDQITEGLSKGASQVEILVKWDVFLKSLKTGTGGVDIMAIIQQVLRDSYMESQEDLEYYAEKVKSFNEQKEAIRDHLQDIRDMTADLSDYTRSQGIEPSQSNETPSRLYYDSSKKLELNEEGSEEEEDNNDEKEDDPEDSDTKNDQKLRRALYITETVWKMIELIPED